MTLAQQPAGSSSRTPRRPGPTSVRGPALYVLGWESGAHTAPVAFRLPAPPSPDGPLGVSAAERRIRKAYFATLDALATGRVDPDAEGRLARLTRDVRFLPAHRALQRLQRAQRFVREEAAGWPVIAAPRAPLTHVVVTVPASPAAPLALDPRAEESLARRYRWALDWLQMHRWVAGRGLVLEWRSAAEAPAGIRSLAA